MVALNSPIPAKGEVTPEYRPAMPSDLMVFRTQSMAPLYNASFPEPWVLKSHLHSVKGVTCKHLSHCAGGTTMGAFMVDQ